MSDNHQIQVECEQSIKRASRAYGYMMGTMNHSEMYDMWCDIQDMRECWDVVSLSAQSVAEQFIRNRWDVEDPWEPGFPGKIYDKVYDYACRAAEHISYDYEFHGYDDLVDRGTDLIDEYAADEGYQWPGELGMMSLCASERQETGA